MLTKTKLENYTNCLNIPLNIERYKRALFIIINNDNTKKLQVCFTKADGSTRYLIGDIKNRIKYLDRDNGTFVYSKRDSMLGLRKNLKQIISYKYLIKRRMLTDVLRLKRLSILKSIRLDIK